MCQNIGLMHFIDTGTDGHNSAELNGQLNNAASKIVICMCISLGFRVALCPQTPATYTLTLG